LKFLRVNFIDPNQRGDTISNEFKPGATVRLKSGGPLMTLATKNTTNGHWNVEWFDNNQPKHGAYLETSLELDDGKVSGF
jgi:uncharacterized protein YodC (DUF2158 family)